MSRPTPLKVNVPDTALVLEGGGMRAAYSSAVVATLINNGIVFPYVAGISAGSSCLANYVSSDPHRAKITFTSFAADPQFGNWRTFVRGKGLFNADYIYQHTSEPGEALPFNLKAYEEHPADFSIEAFRMKDGVTARWNRSDIKQMKDLMVRVQASSTMPILMPPVRIDGDLYVDGALGPDGGIPLTPVHDAGFKKFLIILTQERGYRKSPARNPWFIKQYFRAYPAVVDALLDRPRRYNETRERVFELERAGQAYVFTPERMPIGNGETDVGKLAATYALGFEQIHRELPAIKEFLGL